MTSCDSDASHELQAQVCAVLLVSFSHLTSNHIIAMKENESAFLRSLLSESYGETLDFVFTWHQVSASLNITSVKYVTLY